MRRDADLREIDDYRAHLRALGRMVRRRKRPAGLAPVVSLAEARARRAGHPSAWRDETPTGTSSAGAHVRVLPRD